MTTTNKILLAIICLLVAGITYFDMRYISETHAPHTHEHEIRVITETESDLPEDTVNQPEAEIIVDDPELPSLESPYLGSYTIEDTTHGNMTSVDVTNTTRTITTNTLPNHAHGDFPSPGNPNEIAAIQTTYSFPTNPIFTGVPKDARQAFVGINGIPFEPGTAERVTCASGEEYRVVGLQDLMDLGMDMNNAHVQPTGLYHYHGSPRGLIDFADQGNDLVHIGFATDGHLVYYSKDGTYTSSYVLSSTPRTGDTCVISGPRNQTVAIADTMPDGSLEEDWVFSPDSGDLDTCNGITIGDQYIYVVTDKYPFISRCLMGEFTEETRPAGANLERSGNRPPNR